MCECTLHIFYSPHFFFKAAKATLCLPCFLCKVGPTRISVKEEEEEWVEVVLVLVFETSSCNKRAREGRGSKNSSQPSEEIAVGRELLSRNVLTFSNFSCFPFPPPHRIDNFIHIIATLERRQIKQRDPEQLAGHPSLFHPFFLQRIKIFLLPSD